MLVLRKYQEEGVRFLVSGFHRLLADDMGLGKTIQVIAAADSVNAKTIVIICPAQVKYHWARKFGEFSKESRHIFVIKNGKSKIPPGASVIIVNYELILRNPIFRQLLAKGQKTGFDIVVCDEAHLMKSLEAQRTKRILGKGSFIGYARYKWMLTGTPVLNRPSEIYPIVKTLAPGILEPYTSWYDFGKQFCKARKTPFGWDMKGASNTEDLAERLKGFMLRRTTEQVDNELPEVVSDIIELDISSVPDMANAPLPTVRRELAIAKIPAAKHFIEEMLEETEKVVVFAHHREVIEKLRKELAHVNPVIAYGGMTSELKQKSIDAFTDDPSVRVFIGQTLAGGTGIDGLQTVANRIVFVELDWSPGIMDQAIGRCRRIGQTKTVFVYYLAVPNSLDTYMAEVVQDKKKVVDTLLAPNNEENQTMSDEILLGHLGSALNSIAAALSHISGDAPAAGKPAAPAKKATKATAAADPEVTEPKKQETTKSKHSKEDVIAAAGAFIASTPQRDKAKELINKILNPKYGVSTVKDVKPADFEAYIHDLGLGFEHWLAEEGGTDDANDELDGV